MNDEPEVGPLYAATPKEIETFGFKDISGLEEWREYVFPGNVVYRVDAPAFLAVKNKPLGDSHRLICADGTRHYIPAGWVAMRFRGKWGL